MARRKLSEEGRRRIAEAARARWARARAAKAQGIVTIGGRPGRKSAGGRRGRPSSGGAANVSDLGGRSTDELVALRRHIDQELVERMVREYKAR